MITAKQIQDIHAGLSWRDAELLANGLNELADNDDHTTNLCFPLGVYVFTEPVHLHRIGESDYKPSAVTHFPTEQDYVQHLAKQAEQK